MADPAVDRTTVTERPPGGSWVSTAPDVSRPGPARRLLTTVRAGLYRPLAEDEARAAYWVGHARIGVLLSEVAALAVIGYTLVTDSAGRHSPMLLGLATATMVGVPCLLLLPLPAMMRDSRGPTMFYAWTLATTAVVVVGTRLDGGSSSPLDALLLLTLTFMAVACSPYGVVAMGTVMTLSYLLFVELPGGLSTTGLFFLAILGAFTMVCAVVSSNSWAAHDRQLLLIRARGTLASTDPLTGIPDRRAFIDRVTRAVHDAAWGHQSVVCLVDLGGFTAVNDAGGHAEGDAMLTAVGIALSGAVRETDTVARLGGDEFAVLADASVSATGEMLAERLRAAVAQVGGPLGVTASVGIAEVEPGDDVEDLMHRADAAMYRSKTAGGDRATSLAY